MVIKLDENNYIQGYAVIGGIDGGVEVDLTENQFENPCFEAYRYIDGRLILDEERLNTLMNSEKEKPLSEIDELKQRIADLEALVTTLLEQKKS